MAQGTNFSGSLASLRNINSRPSGNRTAGRTAGPAGFSAQPVAALGAPGTIGPGPTAQPTGVQGQSGAQGMFGLPAAFQQFMARGTRLGNLRAADSSPVGREAGANNSPDLSRLLAMLGGLGGAGIPGGGGLGSLLGGMGGIG